jgi:histidinol dehydrogenase
MPVHVPSGATLPVVTDLGDVRRRLTRRRGFEETALSPRLQASITRLFGEPLSAQEVVDRILRAVRDDGDHAVNQYTRLIDGETLSSTEVSQAECRRAFDRLDAPLQDALRIAAEQIERFHRHQLRTSWLEWTDEGALGQLVRPLDRIGVYAPGGTAAYPSTVLMTAVPARVAGVEQIILCAPPTGGGIAPTILAAAHVAQVDHVFQIGGAQAIGAMAFGTESVPHVDKIFGPGNIFVALAKRAVYGIVGIDTLAGPTETLLVADTSADPSLLAADLLAQAEHDAMASAIMLTTDALVAEETVRELHAQVEHLERREIAWESLQTHGLIGVVPDIETAIELANLYAPEHLCLLLSDPWAVMPLVRHAGGIFVGEHSPEALGDYTAGPSHVMPTGGAARFSSPIHVADFTKTISVAAANARAIQRLGSATADLARAEGLTGHARAIEKRMESLNETGD